MCGLVIGVLEMPGTGIRATHLLAVDPTSPAEAAMRCDRVGGLGVGLGAMKLAVPACCLSGQLAAAHIERLPSVPSLAGRHERKRKAQRASQSARPRGDVSAVPAPTTLLPFPKFRAAGQNP